MKFIIKIDKNYQNYLVLNNVLHIFEWSDFS